MDKLTDNRFLFSFEGRINRFKYWYALLFNALLDFCIDNEVSVLYSPTGEQMVSTIKRQVRPDLFLRIYNYVSLRYKCREVLLGSARYWEIPVAMNCPRVARLAPTIEEKAQHNRAEFSILIFHDVEENVDTEISPVECARNLTKMLEVEKSFGIRSTFNVIGSLFPRKRDEIHDSNH